MADPEENEEGTPEENAEVTPEEVPQEVVPDGALEGGSAPEVEPVAPEPEESAPQDAPADAAPAPTEADAAGTAEEAVAEAGPGEQAQVSEESTEAAEAAGAPPEEESAAKPARRSGPSTERAKDVVPGANLEPIAITEERELTAEEKARLEAEAEERASREAAARDDEEELPRRATVAVPTDASIRATGKRKSSVARVILRSGGGSIQINGRGLDDYFPRPHHQSMARQPLISAGYDGSVDVTIRVHGGGIAGQAGAVRHGIARALCDLDPELRPDLKKRGLLTRDARAKERRKAGLKKARKRPQFSKR